MDLNNEIYVIVTRYMDGEIKEIISYVTTETVAFQKVVELSSTLAKYESFIMTTY